MGSLTASAHRSHYAESDRRQARTEQPHILVLVTRFDGTPCVEFPQRAPSLSS